MGSDLLRRRPRLAGYDGKSIAVGIRPENVCDASTRPEVPATARIRAQVELVESLGSDVYIHVTVDASPVDTEALRELAADIGLVTPQTASTSSAAPLIARCHPDVQVRVGDTIELVIDLERLYLFDLVTGSAIV